LQFVEKIHLRLPGGDGMQMSEWVLS